jgi:hypothetical protein
MKPKLHLAPALVLSGLLTGCVMHRDFRGSTANLKADGGETSNVNALKMSVASSGVTTNGGNYLVISLPEQNCQLVLFYPKMKLYPYYCLRAEIGTNQIRAWQIEHSQHSTNYVTVSEELPPNQTDVWLKRVKSFNRSELATGVTGGLPVNAERLHGSFEMMKDGGVFHINAHLSGDNGVELSGIFDSYKSLWSPLIPVVVPIMLLFGGGE